MIVTVVSPDLSVAISVKLCRASIAKDKNVSVFSASASELRSDSGKQRSERQSESDENAKGRPDELDEVILRHSFVV